MVGFHDVDQGDGGAQQAKLYGETESLVSLTDDGVDVFAVVKLTILYASQQRFRVQLPAGYDVVLDQLNHLARSGETQVEAYQEKLRMQTGIGSLKIRSHKSFGLLIEVTRTHQAKVPKDFIRRQTMVNCERFTTVELNELNETVTSAADKAIAREAEIYGELTAELAKFRMDLRSVAQQSFREVAPDEACAAAHEHAHVSAPCRRTAARTSRSTGSVVRRRARVRRAGRRCSA